jgi:hypothetical protein
MLSHIAPDCPLSMAQKGFDCSLAWSVGSDAEDKRKMPALSAKKRARCISTLPRRHEAANYPAYAVHHFGF